MKEYEANIAPYPLAMGCEEEKAVDFIVAGGARIGIDSFWNDFYAENPNTQDSDHSSQEFKLNGSRVYEDCGSPEIATPECRNPKELATYVHANDFYFERMVKDYIGYHNEELRPRRSDIPLLIGARLQRRSKDSKGNSKGCHDNFDLTHVNPMDYGALGRVIAAHSLTRPFISGAGSLSVGDDGEIDWYNMSQKMTEVDAVDGGTFGTGTTLYRIDQKKNVIELRSSDHNISSWATWMRIGSSALIVAMAGTPLIKEIDSIAKEMFGDIKSRSPEELNHIAAKFNVFGLSAGAAAVDFQERVATLALDKLQLHVDTESIRTESGSLTGLVSATESLPDMYFRIANEWLKYVDDYRVLTKGDAELGKLNDRSDWTRKLKTVTDSIEKWSAKGMSSKAINAKALQLDFVYDTKTLDIRYRKDDDFRTVDGHGRRDRKSDDRSQIFTDHEFGVASRQAPPTRARLRSEFIKEFGNIQIGCWLEDISWNSAKVRTNNAVTGEEKVHIVHFPDNPAQTELDNTARYVCAAIRAEIHAKEIAKLS